MTNPVFKYVGSDFVDYRWFLFEARRRRRLAAERLERDADCSSAAKEYRTTVMEVVIAELRHAQWSEAFSETREFAAVFELKFARRKLAEDTETFATVKEHFKDLEKMLQVDVNVVAERLECEIKAKKQLVDDRDQLACAQKRFDDLNASFKLESHIVEIEDN